MTCKLEQSENRIVSLDNLLEYFKYLDELEILRREKVNTPKREEELIKKIEEREEVGKQYAEYKRNLKKWIESLRDNEIINLLIN